MKVNQKVKVKPKNITIEMLNKLDPIVMIAPNTAHDPFIQKEIPNIPSMCIKYLFKFVKDEPWLSQLTLALLVMASRNYDNSSIYAALSVIHSKMKVIFNYSDRNYQPKDFKNFYNHFDYLIKLYLEGNINKNDSKETRITFYNRLRTLSVMTKNWLEGVSFEFKREYGELLFPIPNSGLYLDLIKKKEIIEEQQQRRKMQVDTLMPYYTEIRSESHIRWNFICRLNSAYKSYLNKILNEKNLTFPIQFKYIDKSFEYNFLLWDVNSYINKNNITLDKVYEFIKIKIDIFPELKSILDTSNGNSVPIESALWFAEPLKHACTYPKFNEEDIKWQKAWGYSAASFASNQLPNIMYWNDISLMKLFQSYSQGLLIPISQLHLALSFGMLAVDLFTTTGIRINEALQVNLSKECLVRLIIPPVPGAINQKPIIRYSLRLIPKGEKCDNFQDNFIGEETKRLLFKIGTILHEHYNLKEGDKLPSIPFNPHHKRAHRFKDAPYIFQAYGRHFSDALISSCLRLLVHDVVKTRTKDGSALQIRAHLLRHGFATHAVQVEKIPVDIVGKWLHQKSLSVTQYYSEVTDSMVADAADQYLIKIASHINVLDAVKRSPEELRELYIEAANRTGTLAKVTGGDCTSHGLCKTQFACVGCAAKVPDPAKKDQIIHHQQWAKKEMIFYREQGLLLEVKRLEKLVTDADLELQEIELIEKYRADEEDFGRIEVEK